MPPRHGAHGPCFCSFPISDGRHHAVFQSDVSGGGAFPLGHCRGGAPCSSTGLKCIASTMRRRGGVPAAKRALSDKGCRIVAKEELSARAEECDILVLSPGIPIDHPLPLLFRRQKKRVMGEMELGALALRSPAVAVTGTNGKTTTVTHARGRLSGGGAEEPPLREHRASSVCGRAGSHGGCCRPSSKSPSFQLETLSSLRPHVAVILNIAEDHLEPPLQHGKLHLLKAPPPQELHGERVRRPSTSMTA